MFGFERSGTTLLSMMTGAHADLAVPLSVTGLWYRYARRLDDYQQLSTRQDLERLVDDLLAEERIGLLDAHFQREAVLDDLPPGDFAAVIRRFHEIYAAQQGKTHWGNLDIATLTNMDVTNRLFPDARFIHIVRDGRDVALSHETYVWGAATTLDCAEQWLHEVRLNLKMGAMIGSERYLVIRYEDLILEAEQTLRRICDFIGVPYSEAMLSYPGMVDQKIPDSRRFLWPVLNQPPDKSKVHVWRNRMGKNKRMVFEGIANGLLKELGYDAYDRVPGYPGGYLYELWCFLNRGGRRDRVLKKLGLKKPPAANAKKAA